MAVVRQYYTHGPFPTTVPPEDLAVVMVLTAIFCLVFTETCRRVVSPWIMKKAGTLGQRDKNGKLLDDAKTLEMSVRMSTVVYTNLIYFPSLYDHIYSPYAETPAHQAIGFGYIQSLVAASLMTYMAVDSVFLFLRLRHGMAKPRFWTVFAHHFVTFWMQPVSWWGGYWQYYGNLIVIIAESTSLVSNLNVLLPDLGFPRHTKVFQINTLVFGVLFIACRVGGMTWLVYDMYHLLWTDAEVWAFYLENPALLNVTVILLALWFVGLLWSWKLWTILVRTMKQMRDGVSASEAAWPPSHSPKVQKKRE